MIETKTAWKANDVNKLIVIGLATLLLGWGLGASDEPVKIGVVDLDQAITSTDAGKQAREELERKEREAAGKLQPMVEQYKERVQELEAKRFVLSDEALREKQLDLAELKNRIESEERELKGQLQVDFERVLGPMRKKMKEIVEDIGRKEGFSLIIQRGSPGLMYSREALDITDLIIERFNKKS